MSLDLRSEPSYPYSQFQMTGTTQRDWQSSPLQSREEIRERGKGDSLGGGKVVAKAAEKVSGNFSKLSLRLAYDFDPITFSRDTLPATATTPAGPSITASHV